MSPTNKNSVCSFQKLSKPINSITLNGKDFSLFKDYTVQVKSELKDLSFTDKLKYLEARAKLVFLDAVDEILFLQKSQILAKFHDLNIITIICCGIESLGHYLIGKGDGFSGDSFRAFVVEFMPDYSTVVDQLWYHFRNGLAHGFCIKYGGIERDLDAPFKVDGQEGLKIDFDFFVSDFERAFNDFFRRLEANRTQYETAFTKIFEELLIA